MASSRLAVPVLFIAPAHEAVLRARGHHRALGALTSLAWGSPPSPAQERRSGSARGPRSPCEVCWRSVCSALTSVPVPTRSAPRLSVPDLQTPCLAWPRLCLVTRDLHGLAELCLTWVTITGLILTPTCRLTSQVDLRPSSSPQTVQQSGLWAALWDHSSTVGLTMACQRCVVMAISQGLPWIIP